MIYIGTYNSPLGKLYMAVEEGKLVGLWLEDQKYFAATILKEAQTPWPMQEAAEEYGKLDHSIAKKEREATDKTMRATVQWLDKYFAGQRPQPQELPLQPKGSEFRQSVWQELLKIPYGETVTYGAIARVIAAERGLKTMSAQAVGGAVGHNPISIIIPCHRVMGGNGSLTGYAGGVDKKLWLLQHERILV